jgi:hypothetical protein
MQDEIDIALTYLASRKIQFDDIRRRRLTDKRRVLSLLVHHRLVKLRYQVKELVALGVQKFEYDGYRYEPLPDTYEVLIW